MEGFPPYWTAWKRRLLDLYLYWTSAPARMSVRTISAAAAGSSGADCAGEVDRRDIARRPEVEFQVDVRARFDEAGNLIDLSDENCARELLVACGLFFLCRGGGLGNFGLVRRPELAACRGSLSLAKLARASSARFESGFRARNSSYFTAVSASRVAFQSLSSRSSFNRRRALSRNSGFVWVRTYSSQAEIVSAAMARSKASSYSGFAPGSPSAARRRPYPFFR